MNNYLIYKKKTKNPEETVKLSSSLEPMAIRYTRNTNQTNGRENIAE